MALRLLLTENRSYTLDERVLDHLIDDLMIQGSPFSGEHGYSHLPGGLGASKKLNSALKKIHSAAETRLVLTDRAESRAVATVLLQYGIKAEPIE